MKKLYPNDKHRATVAIIVGAMREADRGDVRHFNRESGMYLTHKGIRHIRTNWTSAQNYEKLVSEALSTGY